MMSCLPIVSDSCDQREQVFRVGAAAPRVFNSKYLLLHVTNCRQFVTFRQIPANKRARMIRAIM